MLIREHLEASTRSLGCDLERFGNMEDLTSERVFKMVSPRNPETIRRVSGGGGFGTEGAEWEVTVVV